MHLESTLQIPQESPRSKGYKDTFIYWEINTRSQLTHGGTCGLPHVLNFGV